MSTYPLIVTGGISELAGYEVEIGPGWELDDAESPAQPVRRAANATSALKVSLVIVSANQDGSGIIRFR